MNPTLQQYLSSVEEREKKATTGRWIHCPGDSYDAYPSVKVGDCHFILYDHSEADEKTAQEDVKFPGANEDAAFIANAKTDIPLQTAIIRKMAEALEIATQVLMHDSSRYQAVQHIQSEIETLITQATKP